MSAWQKRISHLEPHLRRTDILGALLLASQMFQQSGKGSNNLLVILSDMRQDTNALSLEGVIPSKPDIAIAKLKQQLLIADLRRVHVFVLGVDNRGKNLNYWNFLRTFWSLYLTESGANVHEYTTLREISHIVH